MVVEQRIGRIQRLASEYANVVVYNITLRGTFEEYIVGRLIEKLQMASNAIGDVDSFCKEQMTAMKKRTKSSRSDYCSLFFRHWLPKIKPEQLSSKSRVLRKQ